MGVYPSREDLSAIWAEIWDHSTQSRHLRLRENFLAPLNPLGNL